MTWLEALILGLLQGLTEFLPVSSSGHIELGKALLDIRNADNATFSVIVHAATALSTIVVFGKDIARLTRGLFRPFWSDEQKFALKIVLSMLPVGLVGVLFKHELDVLFQSNVLLVGCCLLATAALLATAHFVRRKEGELTYGRAFIIGLAQMVAILPGLSRSGATICTALLIGVRRTEAARFSFLMVLPPIAGATLLEAKDAMEASAMDIPSPMALTVGFVAAFVTGVFACRLMIKLVQRHTLLMFAIYCLLLGGAAVIYTLTNG